MGWVSQSEHSFNKENHTAIQNNTTLSTKSWCMELIISGRNGLILGRSLKPQIHYLKGWIKLLADTFIYLFKWCKCWQQHSLIRPHANQYIWLSGVKDKTVHLNTNSPGPYLLVYHNVCSSMDGEIILCDIDVTQGDHILKVGEVCKGLTPWSVKWVCK